MPFKSQSQRRFFYAKASARGKEGKKFKKYLAEMEAKTPKGKKLPERVKTADVIYHGSDKKIDHLEPRKHFLADRPVVFGTPSRGMALAHLARWTDDDFELGSINDGPLIMEEQYSGAFDKLFKGRKGYLYTMGPEGFEHRPNLMRSERVTERSPNILGREDIEDILSALEDSDVVVKRKTASIFSRFFARQSSAQQAAQLLKKTKKIRSSVKTPKVSVPTGPEIILPKPPTSPSRQRAIEQLREMKKSASQVAFEAGFFSELNKIASGGDS